MGYTEKFVTEVLDWNLEVQSDDKTTYDHRINYVVTQWSSLCNGSLTLYLETLVPAALRFFVTLVDFSDGDVVRWIYRPRGLGTRGRHGRAGILGRLTRSLELREINARYVTNGVKHLWRIDNFGQALFFWWMVAAATADFLYDWTTLLQKSGGCQVGSGVADVTPTLLITNGAFQGASYPIVRSSILPIDMQPTGCDCGSENVQIIASMECTGTNGLFDTTVTLKIVAITAFGILNAQSSFFVPKNGGGSGMVNGEFPKCSFASIDVKTNGSAVNLNNGSFIVTVMNQWNT